VLWWTIQPSRILSRVVFAAQILTCVLILLLSPDVGSKVLLLLAVCRYCDGFFVSDAVVCIIRYHRRGSWTLQIGLAPSVPVVPVAVYRPCHRWLLVRYQQLGGAHASTLVLAPDSLSVKAYSRLCRYLTWADRALHPE